MAEHNELGKKGEELAQRHLQSKGYKILKTNWHYGKEEIDIVATKDDVIAIVEVKTRQSNYYGDPEVFVTRRKQRFLVHAANAFIQQNNISEEARFDIISILVRPDQSIIKHLENAFYPTL